MPNVICMGELLIDFVPTQSNVSLIEAPAFKKAPGGAPANVAVGLVKLGQTVGFMGKVGDDPFGYFLAQTLQDNGVNTNTLLFSKEAKTTLAFVSLDAQADRSFMFYRDPGADMLFRPDEVDEAALRSSKIFHYGSISLISEPSYSATLQAIATSQAAGLIISYDPNLRPLLWPSIEAAKAGLLTGWQHAQVIKASDEEITFLTGKANFAEGVQELWHDQLKLLVVTQGAAGCTYFTTADQGQVPGFSVEPVDSTGAGDGFVAGLLTQILAKPNLWERADDLKAALRLANAVGALASTQRGAIPAMPTLEAVTALLTSDESLLS